MGVSAARHKVTFFCSSCWPTTAPVNYPVPGAVGREVFLPSPSGTFLRVFTLTPSPEHTEDVRINLPKGLLAYYVPVVVGPAFDNRVEPLHQQAGR